MNIHTNQLEDKEQSRDDQEDAAQGGNHRQPPGLKARSKQDLVFRPQEFDRPKKQALGQ